MADSRSRSTRLRIVPGAPGRTLRSAGPSRLARLSGRSQSVGAGFNGTWVG